MNDNIPFEQIIQKIDPQSKLLRAWKLKGGVSAQMTALELVRPDGQRQKMIVRQHGPAELKRNPHSAADESRLLQLVHTAGLPAPQPYYLDESGEIFPTPYLVIEYIEGQSEFAPTNLPDYIRQFATHLSRIHQLDGAQPALSFLPRQEQKYAEKLKARSAILDESLNERRVRDTLEALWPLPQRNQPTLLHGDFWPGNLLWQQGQLVAIIDWEDAAIGDPLTDLANSRLELLWAFGPEAMHHFTSLYQSLTALDFTDLPCWDLCAALRHIDQIGSWGVGEATERTMRERLGWFIGQAMERLPDHEF